MIESNRVSVDWRLFNWNVVRIKIGKLDIFRTLLTKGLASKNVKNTMSGSQHTLVYNFLCAANYDNFSKGEREIDAQNERKRKKFRLFSLSLFIFSSLFLYLFVSLFSFPLSLTVFLSVCLCHSLALIQHFSFLQVKIQR